MSQMPYAPQAMTSTMSAMTLKQLQDYAQLHRNDPYVVTMALSIANQKKQAVAAQQGQAGMQPQPKVVDSEIAQMAPRVAPMPEDVGIGQLPAGDMNFAGGGIIAFADGGDVERYQSGGLFETDPAKLRALAEQRLRLEQLRQGRLVASGPYSSLPASAAAQSSGSMLRSINPAGAAGYGLGLYHGDLNEGEAAELERRRAMGPTVDARSGSMPEPGYTRGGFEGDPRLATPATMPVASDAAPTADNIRRAAPGTGAPNAGLGAAAAAAGPRAATETGPSSIDALQQKYFGQIDQEVGGLRNARAGLVAGIKDLAEQNLAATKADIEKRGDVYKGREERLAKQEKGLEGMSDKNMGLALLQAGAAMMSTPGGLGVALGKGVQVGSERYAAGLDKIEAAKSKFAEARDRLDDLRINRDDMNARDIRAAEKDARESEFKGKELLYNGLVSDLGVKQKNVTAIFGAAADALKSDKQIAAERENTRTREGGANARAAAQIAASLNTPDRALWDQLMKKNGNDAAKALEEFKLAKGDKFDVRSSYADYLKAFAGKEGLTPPMSMGAYAGQFGATLPR